MLPSTVVVEEHVLHEVRDISLTGKRYQFDRHDRQIFFQVGTRSFRAARDRIGKQFSSRSRIHELFR